MRPSVRRLEELYQDQIDFHILNIDYPSTTDLAIKYHVNGIPMIVLLDAEGEVANVLFGYQEEEQLVAAVEQLLGGSPQ